MITSLSKAWDDFFRDDDTSNFGKGGNGGKGGSGGFGAGGGTGGLHGEGAWKKQPNWQFKQSSGTRGAIGKGGKWGSDAVNGRGGNGAALGIVASFAKKAENQKYSSINLTDIDFINNQWLSNRLPFTLSVHQCSVVAVCNRCFFS
mgnify:CR=1 FL=1